MLLRAKPLPVPFLILVHSTYIDLPMKMEQTECSETSAYKLQTPGNYPKESIQHIEHGESLKSRTVTKFHNEYSSKSLSLYLVRHRVEKFLKRYMSEGNLTCIIYTFCNNNMFKRKFGKLDLPE